MRSKSKKYKLLIHCRVPQIREGLELHLDSLGFDVETQYADLSQDGIGSKLKFAPDLIIVLLNQSDEAITLAVKIKMFAADVALLWVTPAIPDRYFSFLRTIGVGNIIQLPDQRDTIGPAIKNLLGATNGLP